jgi:hypothetical protein
VTTQRPNPPGPNELIEAWRQQASEMEQRWNDFLNQVMGTEGFAQMMARSMDGYLTLQASFARGMEQYLRALNIPTRTDITQLAERVGMLEEKIETLTGLINAARLADSAERAPARSSESRARRNGPARGARKTAAE